MGRSYNIPYIHLEGEVFDIAEGWRGWREERGIIFYIGLVGVAYTHAACMYGINCLDLPFSLVCLFDS